MRSPGACCFGPELAMPLTNPRVVCQNLRPGMARQRHGRAGVLRYRDFLGSMPGSFTTVRPRVRPAGHNNMGRTGLLGAEGRRD